jgi:hypothetical protein
MRVECTVIAGRVLVVFWLDETGSDKERFGALERRRAPPIPPTAVDRNHHVLHHLLTRAGGTRRTTMTNIGESPSVGIGFGLPWHAEFLGQPQRVLVGLRASELGAMTLKPRADAAVNL